VKAYQGMYWWNERSQADMKPMTESQAIAEAGRRDGLGAWTRPSLETASHGNDLERKTGAVPAWVKFDLRPEVAPASYS
jgi:hypothetical protein